MPKMLMKMDYNNFLRLVDETLGDRADFNTYSIGVGFDLLTAYLRRFAESCIELRKMISAVTEKGRRNHEKAHQKRTRHFFEKT